MTLRLLCAPLLLLSLSCAPPGGRAPARRSWAIVGGTVSPASMVPAAGALVVDTPGDYRVFCSGTLIGDRLVLTAAHCFASLPSSTPVAFFAGLSIQPGDLSPPLSPVESVHQAPGFVGGQAPSWLDNYNDIALVKLKLNPAVTPARLVRPDEVAQLVVQGAGVMLVGFGQTDAGDKTSKGVKHHGVSVMGQVGTHELHVQGNGAPQKCHGDSGGPTLGDLDGTAAYDFRVVGVSSRADTDCTAGSIETRVDAHLSWIHSVGGTAIPCGSGLNPDCPDGGLPDQGLPDGPAADSGPDADDPRGLGGGGGCTLAPGPAPLAGAPILPVILALLWRQRRRRRLRH